VIFLGTGRKLMIGSNLGRVMGVTDIWSLLEDFLAITFNDIYA